MSNVTNLNEEQSNTITIDDVEYVYNDLPDKVKIVLSELSYCTTTLNNMQIEFNRLEMMKRGYTMELAEAMKEVTE